MNENKDIFIMTHLDKATEIQRRMSGRNVVTPGQYTLRKRAGYVMVQSVQLVPPL